MSQSLSIKENFNLAQYNTMGISANTRYFVSVESVGQLRDVLQSREYKSIPTFIIGGGSNILFTKDFNGLVIHINISGKRVKSETKKEVILEVGAGENWHELVMYCVKQGWGGVENLSLIPGSAGAAPIQNIGAYGVELEEVFESLEAVEIETGKIRSFNKNECKFGYRDSVFKNELKGQYIITSVTIKLQKTPQINTSYKALSEKLEEKGIKNPTIREVSDTVIKIRESKLPDPAKIGNTGSFFKNPVISKKQFEKLEQKYPEIPHYPAGKNVKIPAAWLIDQCGWKGKREGDAGVHEMQALVLVNYGEASGEEIWELARKIQQSVLEKFGVSLTPEVNIVE